MIASFCRKFLFSKSSSQNIHVTNIFIHITQMRKSRLIEIKLRFLACPPSLQKRTKQYLFLKKQCMSFLIWKLWGVNQCLMFASLRISRLLYYNRECNSWGPENLSYHKKFKELRIYWKNRVFLIPTKRHISQRTDTKTLLVLSQKRNSHNTHFFFPAVDCCKIHRVLYSKVVHWSFVM